MANKGTPIEKSNGKSNANGSQSRSALLVSSIESDGVGGAQPRLHPKSRFPRLSRPVELVRHTYDAVVIGSGYGGGVAASRMARAGQSVCVLERGKERWPGEYPSKLKEAALEVSVSGLFAPGDGPGHQVNIGDPTKLYHLVVGQDQNAFVASGLGGTSLLNANVFLKADDGTMSLPEWPDELRRPGALDKYYDRAASMLEPRPYPEDFPHLPKLELLQHQAKILGAEFYRVPQTTRFEDGPNNVGVQMQASSLTGMDSTGVNDGSKSSTLVNYISDAWNWGAEIFCECEVRYVKKHPTDEGYLVFFAWHGAKRRKFMNNIHHDLMWIHAKKFVFLGAGTLGTTEILLRSKALGLKMGDRIGRDMSGNGDILAFGYNTDFEVNGMGRAHPDPSKPIGPTITGVIDCRKQSTVDGNPLDGYVIEEGAITEALVPVLQPMLELLPGKIYPSNYGLKQFLRHFVSRQKSRLNKYSPSGSLERSQTYLIMSHDSNQAIMALENDKPVIRWEGVGRSDHVTYLNGQLARITDAVGGTYMNSPFYAKFGQQEITVHPIGGASISKDGTGYEGGTDSHGRVFKGQGREVYDGLVVVDGAAVPTALGVNPFATITALAERSVEAAAERAGLNIDFDTKNGILDLFGPPAHPQAMTDDIREAELMIKSSIDSSAQGIQFTEVMSGYINTEGEIEDFQVATNAANAAGSTARFFLSCQSWDTDNLVNHSSHPAMLTGCFTCASLPGSPFNVLRGKFGLFTQDADRPDTANLTYDFDMISTHGELIHFKGYKVVDRSIALDPRATWKATSTLYVTLTKGTEVVGKGILNIQISDFFSELETFESSGANSWLRLSSATKFFTFFAEQVSNKFFGVLGEMKYPSIDFAVGDVNKRSPKGSYEVSATDGIVSTLLHWLPTTGPKRSDAGRTSPPKVLFIPGAALDHQIFALPTVETNAVEFFQDAGFEVFCVTHRVGRSRNAQKDYTGYDARLDIKAAFTEIHKRQGSEDPIYVIAYCVGSIALSCGLLDGTVPARWLKGLTASSVFFNPLFGTVNNLKATFPISPTTLYQKVAGNWFSSFSSKGDSPVQNIFNQLLRFYPVGSRDEICNSVVCHRAYLAFGRLWSHKKLNEATHASLYKMLGGITMHTLDWLIYTGVHGFATNNARENLVTPENLQRLKGLQILFISGAQNVVYRPESVDKSYSTLTDAFGQAGYQMQLFEGYDHLDCWVGKDAVRDVYPTVLRHAQECFRT